ncbi:MAG TPA: nicotinamidase [Aquifex aeolicus]|uniref:nicotinamidase n=1 Tax=Aquifex aeolicus TaxID=63363 RepID=A0A9D1CGT2_AQUAO|nr:nicotinamidase [Aquificales bacterium]HIP98858.1 nicotinamidase [Aquifex aeolicus]HIQ26546.1 nicotinamidase [Aquifex aeolicus]
MRVKITSKDGLILVDIQKDFLPGGALPVPEGNKVIEPANRYIEIFTKAKAPIFATRDWHPENHISFKENGGIWPKHCVQNTEGARFADNLKLPPEVFIINKGDRAEFDAYSGFQGTILENLLRERGVKRIFVGGLATDYCVLNTVLGGLNLGFQVFWLSDASKGITPEGEQRARNLMLNGGAIELTLSDLEF